MDSESLTPLARKEHNPTAAAKRITPVVFNSSTGQFQAASLSQGKMVYEQHDYIDVQQTSATVETFVYKLGGSGGTTVATVTVTYTSADKTDIDTIAKT